MRTEHPGPRAQREGDAFYVAGGRRPASPVWMGGSLRDALDQYRALPRDGAWTLGMRACGGPLIRRVMLFPDADAWVDALVVDRLIRTFRRNEALTAARVCAEDLKIRYCLDRGCLVPRPFPPREEAREYELRSIHRIYVAGAGWLSPTGLERRCLQGGCSYPLVLRYQAGVETEAGPACVELSHWEIRRLEARARGRSPAGVSAAANTPAREGSR